MIVFYNKDDGQIIGTIEGRIHDEQHLKMWIGDKDKTDRIVCQWIKVGDGFEPDNSQKDIFINLDKKPSDIYLYKVDLSTKQLILK